MRKKFLLIYFSIFSLGIFVSGIIILLSACPQIARALQGEYSRIVPPNSNNISRNDWNNLALDFLWKEGDTMAGSLQMSGNSIINLAAPTAADTDHAASVASVNSMITDSLGGTTYISWGRADCVAPDQLLYSGYGFGSRYGNYSGGSNPICLEQPAAGPFFSPTAARADVLAPLVTGTAAQVPAAQGIGSMKYVKCAVCYRPNSSCFERFGSMQCDIGSFTRKAYDGYVLGGSIPGYWQHADGRSCVNRNFDNTNGPLNFDYTSLWLASRVQSNFGLTGYNTANFIPCAVCCN